jgi:hypothetical protein
MVSFTPLPLYLRGKSSRYSIDRRLDGPQSRSGRCGEEKNLALPGIETGTSSPTPVDMQTELSRLLRMILTASNNQLKYKKHIDSNYAGTEK